MKLLRELLNMSLDALNNTYLMEMANDRAKVKATVQGTGPQIIRHLINLYVFDSPDDKAGWLKEISGWCYNIAELKMKPNNRRLDAKSFLEWMDVDNYYPPSYLNDLVQFWIDDEYKGLPLRDYDPAMVMKDINRIINELSSMIETDTYIKRGGVRKLIPSHLQ
jgi:hypothetical protein